MNKKSRKELHGMKGCRRAEPGKHVWPACPSANKERVSRKRA